MAVQESGLTLNELALKYRTDKCPEIKHHYTDIYEDLLGWRRESIYKVVEIGIGSEETMFPGYEIGASLRMWRDYFQNAYVYGIDIEPRCMFKEKRIRTFTADQRKAYQIMNAFDCIGRGVDLVVDDGLHRKFSQISTCLTVMPYVARDGLYIIEDIFSPHEVIDGLSHQYRCELIVPEVQASKDDLLIAVRHYG